LVTFVSDIYHGRFRYLSVASQISITVVLDIYQFQFRHHKKQPHLWGCVKTKNSEKLPFILTVSLPHKY